MSAFTMPCRCEKFVCIDIEFGTPFTDIGKIIRDEVPEYVDTQIFPHRYEGSPAFIDFALTKWDEPDWKPIAQTCEINGKTQLKIHKPNIPDTNAHTREEETL